MLNKWDTKEIEIPDVVTEFINNQRSFLELGSEEAVNNTWLKKNHIKVIKYYAAILAEI